MQLKIIRIENRIVTCEIDDGTIIDIARRWFTDDIQEDDVIEFDIEKELGIEVVNDEKVKIAIEEDEEPWDTIDDEEVKEDFI